MDDIKMLPMPHELHQDSLEIIGERIRAIFQLKDALVRPFCCAVKALSEDAFSKDLVVDVFQKTTKDLDLLVDLVQSDFNEKFIDVVNHDG